jgi:hypothetical protein
MVTTILVEFLKWYFKQLDHSLAPLLRKLGLDSVAALVEAPERGIDERISKIDEAKRSLVEGLRAIDQLKSEAEQNKKELSAILAQLEKVQLERVTIERELEVIRTLAKADTASVRKVMGIPTPQQIWKERIYGFVSGVFASVVASAWLFCIKVGRLIGAQKTSAGMLG